MERIFLYILIPFLLAGRLDSYAESNQDHDLTVTSVQINDDDESIEEEEDFDYESSMKIFELQEKIESFFKELNDLQNSYSRPFQITREQRLSKTFMKRLNDDQKLNERKLKSIDLRWNIFYQGEQAIIASDEELLTMVDDLNNLKQNLEDSISNRQIVIKGVGDFNAAEKFLADQDTIYKIMGKKAMELSLSSKTAPLLENLKVKEQIIFSDIQNHYDAARQGAQLFKISQQDKDDLDNKFASLKNKSGKIQEMAYKPLIQRIKDYLIGIAAIAIIIMFVNMIVGKIKAAKKMKENMKKYQESLNQNGNNDIPSI